MKRFVARLVILGVFFFTLVPFSVPLQARASASLFFGGEIDNVVYCTCLYYPGVVLFVNDKASHSSVKVMYSSWFSRLHQNYNIWESGPNVIGGFQKGGSCLNQKSYYCSPNEEARDIDGTIDWIRGIGSSMSGGSSFGLSF